MNSRRNKVVIIAGGGTGGHIYPGIAIARAIEKIDPDTKVHFVGAVGCLEEEIVPRENFPLHTVRIGRLHKSVGFIAQLKTVLQMPLAFIGVLQILIRLRPVAVLGVGGFASGPMLFAAALLGFRSLIWEPNAYPGLTNRILSRWVDGCLVVFEKAGSYLHSKHLIKSGLPVRSSMLPSGREKTHRTLRLLIFGGSQGARAVNSVTSEALKIGGWLDGVEVVHQSGSADFERMQTVYSGAPPVFQVFEYFHDMDQRYAWADLVICRSGASTVAEICACQKAALFIPLPTAADDHQRKNAEVLKGADAALICLQNELTPAKLRELIIQFRDDRSKIDKIEAQVRQFHFPNAAEKIADKVLGNS